jgi:hypothetical protein
MNFSVRLSGGVPGRVGQDDGRDRHQRRLSFAKQRCFVEAIGCIVFGGDQLVRVAPVGYTISVAKRLDVFLLLGLCGI